MQSAAAGATQDFISTGFIVHHVLSLSRITLLDAHLRASQLWPGRNMPAMFRRLELVSLLGSTYRE